MKKLSEYRDEEALDLIADLLEPAVMIFADDEFASAYRAGKTLKAVKAAIKNHKRDVMEILAIMEGVPLEEYHCNILTLPMRLVEILNDEALREVFTLQVQTILHEQSSVPATANIQAAEQ